MGRQPDTLTCEEVVEPVPCDALSAPFDDGAPVVRAGDPLPPLWHWVALPTRSPSSLLDVDGHPRRGSFLPPVAPPRRMFAGGSVGPTRRCGPARPSGVRRPWCR